MVAAKSVKILMLGAVAVGKTSIANRIAHDQFSEDYKSTIGVQLFTVDVEVGAETIKAVIWDTDGDMDTGIFKSPYVLGASGALVVCDVRREQTFETMLRLSDEIEEQLPGRPHVCVFNKTDLKYPSEEAIRIAKEHNRVVGFCSALSGEGVTEALTTLVERIIDLDSTGY